jgi:aminoglycoside phosphotransferase (APT) family kinase protein
MLDSKAMPELIERWLRLQGRDESVIGYEIMTGGYSRVMARVDLQSPDGQVRRLVMRGDPPAELQTLTTDRDLEWSVISWLCENQAVSTATGRWYVDDPSHWGTKAMFLDHLEGQSLQAALDQGADHAPAAKGLCALMAEVAAIDAERLPATLVRPRDWDTYIDEKIAAWHRLADDHVEALPTIRYLASWLDAHRPPPAPLRLVHGDLQPSNILVDPAGDWYLIDWEYARIGDPREELGYYMAYTQGVPPNLFASDLPAILAEYRELTGFDESVVNPATVAWWTTVATLAVVQGLHDGLAGMAAGTRHGVAASFNAILVTVGYESFFGAVAQMEQLMKGLA